MRSTMARLRAASAAGQQAVYGMGRRRAAAAQSSGSARFTPRLFMTSLIDVIVGRRRPFQRATLVIGIFFHSDRALFSREFLKILATSSLPFIFLGRKWINPFFMTWGARSASVKGCPETRL